jgi:hypothetical protein
MVAVMIDTFQVKYPFTSFNQKQVIVEAINAYAGKNTRHLLHLKEKLLKHGIWYYHTQVFEPYGMLEVAIEDIPQYHMSFLLIKCKPALIIHPSDEYALCTRNDYAQTVRLFSNFVGMLNGYIKGDYKLPTNILSWEIFRVDYAFGFFTEHFARYLSLLKKGYTKRRDDKYQHGFRINMRDYNINFYDKTVRLNHDTEYKHNLRFEVQCRSRYLSRLVEKQKIEGRDLFCLWDMRLAKNIVFNRIISVAGYCDFYDMNTASEKICARFHEKKATMLTNLLMDSLSPQARLARIPLIYELHTGISKKYTFKNLLPALREVGVNLYALPANWRLPYLPNPITIINAQVKQK